MQKFKIIIILFAFALVLTGCGHKKETQEQDVISKNNNNNIAATFGQDQENMDIQTDEEEQASDDSQSEEDGDPSTPGVPSAQDDEVSDEAPKDNPIIYLKTSKGDIKIELFLNEMPITAGNFLKLAKEGYYDGITFHRVIPNFMIQGGDPLSKDENRDNDGTGGPGYFIKDEFVQGATNVRGTLSMANAGPDTGGSQFFINIADNTFLDYDKEPLTSKHPVFGIVLDGMDIVDSISLVEKDARDNPVEKVEIQSILVE